MSDDFRWWTPRRPGELTTEFLGRVLDAVGLDDMAKRARQGHFDDYFCPADVDDGMNMLHLVQELDAAASAPATRRNDRPRIRAMIEGVKAGEWDGTKEESDRWAKSKGGRELIDSLGPVGRALGLAEDDDE